MIDVSFLIISSDLPTFLSMKDMVTNGLALSIQGIYQSYRGYRKLLILSNLFLIYEREMEDMQFIIYYESDLKQLHHNFGHPSVRAIEALPKREKGDTLVRQWAL